jgi:hypothetical protein
MTVDDARRIMAKHEWTDFEAIEPRASNNSLGGLSCASEWRGVDPAPGQEHLPDCRSGRSGLSMAAGHELDGVISNVPHIDQAHIGGRLSVAYELY